MSTNPDGLAGLSNMLRSAIGDLLDPKADTFLDMFADDGVMEFPFAPPGGISRLDGRTALAAYFPEITKMIQFDRFTTPTVYRTTDPGVVVLDFEGFGHGVATGLPYEQRYLSVITVDRGRIVRYLDFWNPIVVLRTVGDEEAMKAALGGGHGNSE